MQWKRQGTVGQPAGVPAIEPAAVPVLSPLSRRTVLVQKSTLFAGISRADCAYIAEAAVEKSLPRRQTIFFVGDPIRQTAVLSSGCVKLLQVGPSGSEVILRLAGPGDLIDSLGLSSRSHYNCSAQTVHPSTVLLWEAPVFEAMAERFPVLRRNILRLLGQRLHEMEERFREISTERVAYRLSSQLDRLLTTVGRQVEGGIEIALSREELAQLTGTTLFTVSRMLSQWELLGIVKAQREAVLICNSQALSQLSAGHSDAS